MLDRLFDVLFQVIGLFQFWTVIDAYEEGVLLRFGKYKRSVGPGLNFHLPFYIDSIKVDNVVPNCLSIPTQSLTTRDGKSVVIEALILWRIEDIKKVILDVEDATTSLHEITAGYIHEQVASNDWEEIRQPKFPDTLKKHIQKQAGKWGIKVMNVKFSDCSLSRSYRLWNARN